MKKRHIASSLLLALAVPAMMQVAAMAESSSTLNDTLDTSVNPYYTGRDIDVSNPGSGTLDLTKLKNDPTMHLELHLVNKSANPVDVKFPALGASYLVPANGDRWADLSTLQVGNPGEVAYTSEAILTAPTKELSLSSIEYILNSDYTRPYVAEAKEEPVSHPIPSSASAGSGKHIRGYW